MSYNVLLSDDVSDYLNSQDRGRQKAILKHLHEMRSDPFKGDDPAQAASSEALSQENRERPGAIQHQGRGRLFGIDGRS